MCIVHCTGLKNPCNFLLLRRLTKFLNIWPNICWMNRNFIKTSLCHFIPPMHTCIFIQYLVDCQPLSCLEHIRFTQLPVPLWHFVSAHTCPCTVWSQHLGAIVCITWPWDFKIHWFFLLFLLTCGPINNSQQITPKLHECQKIKCKKAENYYPNKLWQPTEGAEAPCSSIILCLEATGLIVLPVSFPSVWIHRCSQHGWLGIQLTYYSLAHYQTF